MNAQMQGQPTYSTEPALFCTPILPRKACARAHPCRHARKHAQILLDDSFGRVIRVVKLGALPRQKRREVLESEGMAEGIDLQGGNARTGEETEAMSVEVRIARARSLKAAIKTGAGIGAP